MKPSARPISDPPESRNPVHAEHQWPPAVIAGAYQTGVLAVRNLSRRGVRAICVDSDGSRPGFRSVYGPARHCPDPDLALERWCEFMQGLARELGAMPVLMASSDKFVTAIARCGEVLRQSYRVSTGFAVQGSLADKFTQYRLAAKHGLPMPRTWFVHSMTELLEAAASVTYPCLLKPNHFREWQRFAPGHPLRDRKIAHAASASALEQTYRSAATVTPELVVQDLIPGDDRAKRVYVSCRDARGRKLGAAMFRELRCDPVQFGPASVSEPFADPEVEVLCDRFLTDVGYSGICEFEMKWDGGDGRVKLIEANPRLSGGGDAAPYAGVDLCWLHYLDLIGVPVESVRPATKPFRHIVLRADARAIPAYLRAGLATWRDVIDSYRSPRAWFDVDWRDWRIALETLAVAVTRLIQGFLGGSAKGDGRP